jgi:hypothetical protein
MSSSLSTPGIVAYLVKPIAHSTDKIVTKKDLYQKRKIVPHAENVENQSSVRPETTRYTH